MASFGTYKVCTNCKRIEHHKRVDDILCEKCVSKSKKKAKKVVEKHSVLY